MEKKTHKIRGKKKMGVKLGTFQTPPGREIRFDSREDNQLTSDVKNFKGVNEVVSLGEGGEERGGNARRHLPKDVSFGAEEQRKPERKRRRINREGTRIAGRKEEERPRRAVARGKWGRRRQKKKSQTKTWHP